MKVVRTIVSALAAFLLICCLVDLFGCSRKSDTTHNHVPIPTVSALPEPVSPIVVQGKSWEITIPSAEWVEHFDPKVELLYINKVNDNLILIVSEPTDSYNDYALLTIRNLREQGAEVVSATQQDVNDIHWLLIVSSKNDVKLWQWLSVKDDIGYNLFCGGSIENEEFNKNVCTRLIDTFKISVP